MDALPQPASVWIQRCEPSRVSFTIKDHPPAHAGAIQPSRRTARIDPSLALDPGQSVLDPGLRPGAPRHGEELEPLLDVEVRIHPGRDEIHSRDDAVLRGGRRDFIERSLIEVALVVEWHP